MTSYALSALLIPFGLAAALPPFSRLAGRGQPGLAYLCGWATAIVALWLGGIAGIPLHFVAWALAAAALAGGAVAVFRARPALTALGHPLVVLPLAAILLLLVAGPVTYLIVAWDAWTNWVGWARQMVAADAYFQPDMWIATRGDTPGWPLAMALPGFIGGRFFTEDAWAVAMTLHLGLLAMFFDFVRSSVRRFLGFAGGRAALAGWFILLALLAIELSWRLIPTLLLIEEPQYYFLAAAFVALGIGLLEKRVDGDLLCAATLMAIGAYLFKTSFVVYAPSYLLMAAYAVMASRGRWIPDREAVLRIGGASLAIVAAMAIWKFAAPPGRCQSDTLGMVARLVAGEPVYGIPFDVFLGNVFGRMAEFVLAWKLPVTLAALLGFLLFVRLGLFWAAAAAVAMLALFFFAGMVSGMASCFTAEEVEKLASVQRYTRVPMRLVQTCGILLLIVAACGIAARFAPRLLAGRAAAVCLAAAIAVLGAWQVDRGLRAIRLVQERTDFDADFRQRVAGGTNDARLLMSDPAFGSRERPIRVLFIGPPPAVEQVTANFTGLGRERGEMLRHIDSEYRAAEPGRNDMATLLALFDAIGIIGEPGPVISTTPAIASAIQGCGPGPVGYLLIRDPGTTAWRCLPRRAE